MKHYGFILYLLTLLAVFSFASTGTASNESWRIILFDTGSNIILVVTPDGISETWKIPRQVREIALSPTERFAAINFYGVDDYDPVYYSEEILLYDLENRECCQRIATQEMFAETFNGYKGGFSIGGFNETGTLLALNYSYTESSESDFFVMPQTGLAIIDVQTGDLIATKVTRENFAAWFGDAAATYPIVQTLPGAFPEKYIERELQAWNPFTNQTTFTGYPVAALPYYDLHDVGESLITGERIVASFLSVPDEMTNSMVDFSVVLYHTDSTASPIWIEQRPVIDENIDTRNDTIARWIADGRYIYNRAWAYNWGERRDEVQILARDGDIQSVEIPSHDYFLAGTPNGWLALRHLSDQPVLIHYIYENEVVHSEEIVVFDWNVIVLKKPLLGHSIVDPVPFPEVPSPRFLG